MDPTTFPVVVERAGDSWLAHTVGDAPSTRLLDWVRERPVPEGFRWEPGSRPIEPLGSASAPRNEACGSSSARRGTSRAYRDADRTPRRSRGPLPQTLSSSERKVGVDQTNHSVIVDNRAVVKWITVPLVGPHPAPERMRRLAAAGFAQLPAVWGTLEWRTPDGHWVPVATAADLVADATDGWIWCLHEARVALGIEPGPALPFGGELGKLTADMHLALADPINQSSNTETHHRSSSAEAPAQERPGRRSSSAEALAEERPSRPLVAVHGDFHVGQILRDPSGRLYVLDFDGNPTLTPDERVEHRPAAYDVAGMLLSLENVGYVVRKYDPEIPEQSVADWTAAVQQEFLDAYRARAGHLLDDSLLDAYADDQIQRELDYAHDHLPEWRYVPEAALRRRGRL
ncbi:MAG: phosphotransferase [Nocardioidaceae bacterium]